jgi:hypothetical protein
LGDGRQPRNIVEDGDYVLKYIMVAQPSKPQRKSPGKGAGAASKPSEDNTL